MKLLKTYCPRCGKLACKEFPRLAGDTRRPRIQLVAALELIERPQQARRVRCRCGQVLVLIKGKA